MPILTINVAARGTPLYNPEKPHEQSTSNVGHVWFSMADNQGNHYVYAFNPEEGAKGLERLVGEGSTELYKRWGGDDVHYTQTAYSLTIEISQEQFDRLKQFADNPTKDPEFAFDSRTYKAIDHSCVDFTWKALEVIGYNRPQYEGTVWPTYNIPHFMEAIRKDLQNQHNGWIVEKHNNDTTIWCLTNPNRPEGEHWSCEKDTQGQAQVLINGALGKGPSIFAPQEPRLTPAPVEHRTMNPQGMSPQMQAHLDLAAAWAKSPEGQALMASIPKLPVDTSNIIPATPSYPPDLQNKLDKIYDKISNSPYAIAFADLTIKEQDNIVAGIANHLQSKRMLTDRHVNELEILVPTKEDGTLLLKTGMYGYDVVNAQQLAQKPEAQSMTELQHTQEQQLQQSQQASMSRGFSR